MVLAVKETRSGWEPVLPSVSVDRSEVLQERGEFAFESDWSQPAPARPFFEGLASELTDVAYHTWRLSWAG